MEHLLEVKNLEVRFALRFGELTAINGISFTLDKGERLGLVGESGAGKSVTGFAIINLISKPGYISGETLRNVDDRNEYLVISTWKTLEAWNWWFRNNERAELEGRVDALLGTTTVYKVFGYD